MDLDNILLFLVEGSRALLILLAVLAGGGILHWASKHYLRICRQHGNALAACGLTGELVAQRLLAACGLRGVAVKRSGPRSFYYPRKREIHLNTLKFDSPSLSALTTAAHEVGHAQQFAARILLCRLRSLLGLTHYLLVALVVILPLLHLMGFVCLPMDPGPLLLTLGAVLLLPQLFIQLPLEYDASRRARKLVRDTQLLHPDEQHAFDTMLRAAWLTHAARYAQGCVALVVVAVVIFVYPHYLGQAEPQEATVALAAERPFDLAANRAPAPVPEVQTSETESVEERLPLDLSFFLLSSMAGLVPCVVLCFVLGKFTNSVRTKKSPAEQAIERNNSGLEWNRKGAYTTALREFEAALRLDPNLAVVHYNRGQTYLRLGRLDEALADFDANLRITPGYAYALAARGEVWTQRGACDRAMAEYEEAVRLAPENSCLLSMRGFARLRRGDLAGAFADFESALRVNPKEALAYRGCGMLGMARSDRDQALAGLSQALALGDDDATIYQLRGQVWLYENDLDRALVDFTEALRRDPKQAAALRDRGLVWLFKNEPERALGDLDEAIHLNPTDAVALNNRGAARLRVGHYAGAEADLNEAIRLDPDFPNPYKHLAWLRATCSDTQFRDGPAAVAHATRALELTAWKASAWFAVLAAAYAEAGNFEEAVKWQTKCRDESPANATAECDERIALYQARQALLLHEA